MQELTGIILTVVVIHLAVLVALVLVVSFYVTGVPLLLMLHCDELVY